MISPMSPWSVYISADNSLNIPIQGSGENLSATDPGLRQGRTRRFPRKVIIQTFNPDNYAINRPVTTTTSVSIIMKYLRGESLAIHPSAAC